MSTRETAQLIWFDPGGTTGVAVAAVSAAWLTGAGSSTWDGLRRALAHVAISQTDGNAVKGDDLGVNQQLLGNAEDEMIAECAELVRAWPEAAYGQEDFVLGMFTQGRDLLSPVRINAAVRALVLSEEPTRVPFVQAASLAKSTANDGRMKTAGLYRPGVPHGTDAARHVATFFRRARSDAKLREAAWPELFA